MKSYSSCGCPPIIAPEELICGSSLIYYNRYDADAPIASPEEVKKLKDKVICEFQKIMSELKRGNLPPLEFLLEEISAINLADEGSLDNSKFIIQYYLNNVERYLY